MISLLIGLIIGILVIWVVRMLLPLLGLPEPMQRVIYVVLVVIVILWLLTSVLGHRGLTPLTF